MDGVEAAASTLAEGLVHLGELLLQVKVSHKENRAREEVLLGLVSGTKTLVVDVPQRVGAAPPVSNGLLMDLYSLEKNVLDIKILLVLPSALNNAQATF